MMRKLIFTGVAIVTAITVQNTYAQTGEQAIREITVISTTRRPEALGDINASVALLGEEELRLISLIHYQEALNRLPGVSVHRNNGQESLTAIRSPVLTGAGACGSFLVAEQGIPLRASGFCNVNEMFDAHSENASRIEVIRGPGSAFYGSNAVHGMINVVLPEPGETMEFGVQYGPRGYGRFNAAVGTEGSNFKQLLLFNGTTEEGWRDDSGLDQQKLSWLYQYNVGDVTLDGGLTATNLNQETAGFVVGTNAFEDSNLRDTNPNPEAYRDSQNVRVWTRASTEINGWDMVLTPYFREVNMNFIQHFLPGTPVEDSEHRSIGFQFASYRDLSDDSSLAFGLDMEATDGKLKQFQDAPTQGSAFLRNTIPEGLHYDYEVEATQAAAFVNYEKYWDSGWDITLGLRLERTEYDYDNQALTGRTKQDGTACGFGGCRYSRPADRKDSFNSWSPKLALRYQLNDNHNLQLRAQRGFRAPQATELYRLQNAQTVAGLDSVELDSYEVAFNGAADNWDYSATVYYMDKDNEIVTDSSRINLNGSHTKHRGIEFGLGYDISSTLSFRGAFNLASHTYENDELSGDRNINGNDVDTAPNSFGNFRIQWRPLEALLMELEWVNMGEYYTNPENTADYEGHDIFNLRTQYEISSDLSLSLNILNLADKKYAERADWTTFTGDRYFPGEPLRAFVSVDWKYR